MSFPRNAFILGAGGALALACAASAATINVPTDFTTIQAAIDSASNGDVILVAPGTYNEAIDFNGRTITIRSTGGPQLTTIDATGQDTSVVTVASFEGAATKLEGFTLTGGVGTDAGSRRGGAVYVFDSELTIQSCIMRDNTADLGGAIYFFSVRSTASVNNCLIYDNTGSQGGAMYYNFSNTIVRNVTMTNNTAASGAGIYSTNSIPRLFSCIMWANTGAFDGPGTPLVTHSNIEGGFAGTGNINVDPLFTDASSDVFTLTDASPCIDAGDSEAVAELLSDDLAGDPRGVNIPATADTGVPILGICVDMGAFEVQQDCSGSSSCESDLTGDNVVDTDDLFHLLGDWGPCP
jgi:hypothetical protein